MSFHNGSNYDYRLIIKELAKDVETKFNFIAENFEKYKTFSLQITKDVKEIEKKRKKSRKPYLTNYNLLIVQDLLQFHCQILLIILLKWLMKLNVNI